MKREAKLIAPVHYVPAGTGPSLVSVIVAAFGGDTVHRCQGYWIDGTGRLDAEDVDVHTFAADDGDNERIRAIAGQHIGIAMRQAAVYFVDTTGAAHILERGTDY